ncbi:MAG: zinc-binding dehydrogenase, partial [Chloroflexi bacterium]|nr:zinc-binding dehydrogenase [Chloroflexota bacterium]
DVILDASGRPSSISFKHSLTSRGVYLTTYPTMSILWRHLWTSLWKGRRVVFAATAFKPLSERLAFLEEVSRLLAEGKMRTIVEQSFELEQMREAHRYIESRAETGNVVVTL